MSLSDPVLTILTPTWNRRALLPRLYCSLQEQAVPPDSFEWLVVDDGSTDGTAQWLEEIAQEAPFRIRVIVQENGGKHRAVNRGASELCTPWVLINDSDDWLLPGGLASALAQIGRADPDPEILAIIAARKLAGKTTGRFQLSEKPVTFHDWIGQTTVGDTSILMRSALMQSCPFPDYEGERFIAESSAFSAMFASGGIFLSNEMIGEAEYQPLGLSDRSVALRVQSPFGAMHCYRAHIAAGVPLRQYLRSSINYHRFWWHGFLAGKRPGPAGFPANPLWLLPGWFAWWRDRQALRSVIDEPPAM